MCRFTPEVVRVVSERPLAGCAEGNDTLLVAFAQDFDVPVLQMNVPIFQGDDLGEPWARVQHEGIDGRIARSEQGVRIHTGENLAHLFGRQGFDHLLTDLGRPQVLEPMFFRISPTVKPGEEGSERSHPVVQRMA